MVSFGRPSQQVTAVVLALAEHPATWRYAAELCQRPDLTAASQVPADQRPRHRYRLTGRGRALAGELAAGQPPRPSPARDVWVLVSS